MSGDVGSTGVWVGFRGSDTGPVRVTTLGPDRESRPPVHKTLARLLWCLLLASPVREREIFDFDNTRDKGLSY